MKWLIAAAVTLALLLGGCGAVVPTEGTTEPTMTEATEAPTTEATEALTTEEVTTEGPTTPTEPITRENLVTEAYRDEYTLSDGTAVLHSIPKINLTGTYAEEANETLRGLYEGQQNDEGVLSWANPYSYEYYVFGDVLTVIVRNGSPYVIEEMKGFDIAAEYFVYRLHVSDGSSVTSEEILETAGVTEEEFYKQVAVGTGNSFCARLPEEYLERALSAEDPTSPLPLTECFKDTIGEDYVHRAIPYLNDDGELQFVGFVRQIAGASYHEVLLPYEQTEGFSPYYERILALAEEE